MNQLSCVLAVAVFVGAVAQASGGVIVVNGDEADGTVGINGLSGNLSDPMIRVGVAGNDVHGQATVFFFALPNLPSRSSLVATELDLQYLGISHFTVTVAPEFNVDLFGVGARSTPTIFGADYYDGDASFSTSALIAEAFITPSTVPGSLHISGSSLLDFVTSLYQLDLNQAYADGKIVPGA